MAQYTVTHTCGHTITHQLYGKGTERERRIAWLATQPCLDCKRAAEREVAAAEATSQALPALTGSEKQIAWALTIRKEILGKVDQMDAEWRTANARRGLTISESDDARMRQARAAIAAHAEAKWWIDHRHETAQGLIQQALGIA